MKIAILQSCLYLSFIITFFGTPSISKEIIHEYELEKISESRLPDLTKDQAVEEPCYEGVIPKFYTNPRTKEIWYYRYSVFRVETSLPCEKNKAFEFRYTENSVSSSIPPNSDNSSVPTSHSFPFLLTTKNYQTQIKHLSEDLFDLPIGKNVGFLSSSLERTGSNIVPVLQTSTPKLALKQEFRLLGIPLSSTGSSEGVYITKSANDENLKITHRWSYLPQVTSNGCWVLAITTPGPDPKHEVNEMENFIIDRTLTIYSLFDKSDLDGVKQKSDELCIKPEWNVDRVAEQSLEGRSPGGVFKGTVFELFDFHEKNINGFVLEELEKGDSGYPIPRANIENTSPFAVDYTAYSPNPGQLDIVFQQGFVSDSIDEKNLSGDLIFMSFEDTKGFRKDYYTGKLFEKPIVDLRQINSEDGTKKFVNFNITENCEKTHQFSGWESSPKISADWSKLFFLAKVEAQNDSSQTNLFVANLNLIREGLFNCKNEQIKNLTSKLEEINYPILNYSVSSDARRVSIWYEIEGETVVKFYKLNKERNNIIYRHPESISGLGKIYDIAETGNYDKNKGDNYYYVLHSRTDFPVSISRCLLKNNAISCGDKFSPIHTTSIGEKIINKEEHYNKYGVVIQKFNKKWVDKRGNPIPGFILRPTQLPKNKDLAREAIVSIHGGPNESWDGRFGQTEFDLASRGYTVYLPNPSGSTGYGFSHTKRGNKEWGTIIYSDILDVLDYVRHDAINQPNLRFDKVYLMGFSFGGYIANWIQADPKSLVDDKVDALIAINPIFDLNKFSASTDQYWFPEYQLGCSGEVCETDQFACRENSVVPVIEQNPACYLGDDIENKLNKKGLEKLPILVIAGFFDQRIPYCHTIASSLSPYRRKGVPYTFKKIESGFHDLGAFQGVFNGERIYNWLTNVKTCISNDSKEWNLSCKDKDQNFVFNNMTQHVDTCLTTINDLP